MIQLPVFSVRNERLASGLATLSAFAVMALVATPALAQDVAPATELEGLSETDDRVQRQYDYNNLSLSTSQHAGATVTVTRYPGDPHR